MDEPQKEAFTPIPNKFLEACITVEFSGQELRLLLFFFRKILGYHKDEDAVSLSQMVKALGISKTRCSQVVNRLQLMKILTVTKNINGIGKSYKLNDNFDEWITVKEGINGLEKLKQTVKVFSNKGLRKTVTTKEKKEKKERGAASLPSLDEGESGALQKNSDTSEISDLPFPKSWKDFLEHLSGRDAPLYAMLSNLKTIEDGPNDTTVFTGNKFMVRYMQRGGNRREIEEIAGSFFNKPVSIKFEVAAERPQ